MTEISRNKFKNRKNEKLGNTDIDDEKHNEI